MEHTARVQPDGTLRCSCGLPHGHVVGTDLVIKSKHHGEVHRVIISIPALLQHVEERATVMR